MRRDRTCYYTSCVKGNELRYTDREAKEPAVETKTDATIEDLYRAPNDWGTYELVDGRLVHMPPTGFGPGRFGRDLLRTEDV